jgi:hypothetical protein
LGPIYTVSLAEARQKALLYRKARLIGSWAGGMVLAS